MTRNPSRCEYSIVGWDFEVLKTDKIVFKTGFCVDFRQVNWKRRT
jgi:hypothetical protein